MYDTDTRPCTDKQVQFIATLVRERNITAHDADLAVSIAREKVMDRTLSSKQANAVIDVLLAQPRKAVEHAEPEEVPAGIYATKNHGYVRVYRGQTRNVMLAKQILGDDLLGEVSYEYLGLASRFVRVEDRLSLEEVGALGRHWDHCMVCGKRLDDPESVDRGIGPICYQKY